ncbi:MAG: DUF3611 family protein [Synechococcaceae cyanobacterium RL_1_2]|nr:DUF3611 family protein [Synechococcaceae cyanobacterium RL_1_2]
MSQESGITPSRGGGAAPASSSVPIAVQKAAAAIRLASTVGFWLQIVLGVISAAILLIASATFLGSKTLYPGIGFGLFCAAAGVIALVVSIFFFFRYKKIANLMMTLDPALRPKKSYTLRIINLGLISNITGMFLTIVGAETLVGLLLGKFLKLPQGANSSTIDPSQLPNAGEFMIALANTHTIFSHFAGIVIALWLINRLNR